MQNELPAIKNDTLIHYTRLGEYEEIDLSIDLKEWSMSVFYITWDDEDASGVEIHLSDVIDELQDYKFLGIMSRGLSIRELQSMFSFKMKI